MTKSDQNRTLWQRASTIISVLTLYNVIAGFETILTLSASLNYLASWWRWAVGSMFYWIQIDLPAHYQDSVVTFFVLAFAAYRKSFLEYGSVRSISDIQNNITGVFHKKIKRNSGKINDMPKIHFEDIFAYSIIIFTVWIISEKVANFHFEGWFNYVPILLFSFFIIFISYVYDINIQYRIYHPLEVPFVIIASILNIISSFVSNCSAIIAAERPYVFKILAYLLVVLGGGAIAHLYLDPQIRPYLNRMWQPPPVGTLDFSATNQA